MDIWKVVAAAGAGYVAQHWKKNRDGSQDVPNSPAENDVFTLSESSPARQQVPEKKFPFCRGLSKKKKEKDVCPDIDSSSHDIRVEEAFNNSFSRETLTLGNLAYGIQHGGEGCSDDIQQTDGDYVHQPSKEVCFCCSPTALRTPRLKGKVLKPRTSLESCLMAQLYTERAHINDYVLDPILSPRTPANSPFVARVKRRKSSRTDGDFWEFPVKIVEKQPGKEFTYSKEEPICGIPHLPRIGDSNLPKQSPSRTERSSSSSTTNNGKHQNFQGRPHGVLLFCLGISAGILSSFLANQQEVDKLNQLLRQTNNLVEDLQDELEMKDPPTVKELVVEDDESQNTHHDSLDYGPSHSPEPNLDDSMGHDQGKYHEEEAGVKSFSKIEAELEAELERLELNMNVTTLEGKLSNLVELEPDFLPDVSVGELKADLFSRETEGQANADQGGNLITTTHPANYSVSPRELSLRLHEVLQSRLEARVKELESALQNSQRKFHFGEYDHIESWRKSSSNPTSPVHQNEPSRASHPVVINLPDEAQETNEANDLFSFLNGSEDDKTHEIITSSRGTSSRPCEQSPCQVPKGWIDSDGDPCLDDEAYNTMSYDLSSSRESDGSSEDEIDKLLIQNIVERARKQGSSVILDAQKVLFSGNENGHIR